MWKFVLCVIAAGVVACNDGRWNPAQPIDSVTPGRNGYVRVLLNSTLWFPDSVSVHHYHTAGSGAARGAAHMRLDAWSDGYALSCTFVLPDTFAVGSRASFVLCRSATLDFITPWPAQNAWEHAGDSSGVMTVVRSDDSTLTGTFAATFESKLATYWLSGGAFAVRVKM